MVSFLFHTSEFGQKTLKQRANLNLTNKQMSCVNKSTKKDTTVPLINHLGFNWKKCILSCSPLVLVKHWPWPCKLMLNIDSTGWWDFDAVVCLQGKCLKQQSCAPRGEQVNVPSASYTYLFSCPPAAQLTLEGASHPRKPSGSCFSHMWPGWVLPSRVVGSCACLDLPLQPLGN